MNVCKNTSIGLVEANGYHDREELGLGFLSVSADFLRRFQSVIVRDLKMAACCSIDELPGQFPTQNDNLSDFGSSDSDSVLRLAHTAF